MGFTTTTRINRYVKQFIILIYSIMAKNIKTYGEIEYYLYDGDKKESKVSRQTFLTSKGSSVTHFTPKPEQTSTKSETGKVIESFDLYCEKSTANLAVDQQKHGRDMIKKDQSISFDGGDGPAGTEVPEPYKSTIKNVKKFRGSNVKHEQDTKRKRDKELSKEYRIAKLMDYQTEDDLVKPGVPVRKPHVYSN